MVATPVMVFVKPAAMAMNAPGGTMTDPPISITEAGGMPVVAVAETEGVKSGIMSKPAVGIVAAESALPTPPVATPTCPWLMVTAVV